MIKHFDSKEITHLRCLADAIAGKPEYAGRFLTTLLGIVEHSPKSDPSFIEYLTKLKDDLGENNDSASIRELAMKYKASEDDAIRRMGEVLIWGLANTKHRKQNPKRRT